MNEIKLDTELEKALPELSKEEKMHVGNMMERWAHQLLLSSAFDEVNEMNGLFKNKGQKRKTPRSYKPSYEAEMLLVRANRLTKKNFNKLIDACVIRALWPKKSKQECPAPEIY